MHFAVLARSLPALRGPCRCFPWYPAVPPPLPPGTAPYLPAPGLCPHARAADLPRPAPRFRVISRTLRALSRIYRGWCRILGHFTGGCPAPHSMPPAASYREIYGLCPLGHAADLGSGGTPHPGHRLRGPPTCFCGPGPAAPARGDLPHSAPFCPVLHGRCPGPPALVPGGALEWEGRPPRKPPSVLLREFGHARPCLEGHFVRPGPGR